MRTDYAVREAGVCALNAALGSADAMRFLAMIWEWHNRPAPAWDGYDSVQLHTDFNARFDGLSFDEAMDKITRELNERNEHR